MRTIIILIFGVFIASWSSIFIRLVGDINPLIIAFYRLALSALLLLPFWKKEDIRDKPWRAHIGLIILAGFLLSMHFYSWIASLQMTTVGNSIFLESTHPLFALVFSLLFLREKIELKFLPVIMLGLAGMFLTVAGDLDAGREALTGDLLAIGGAIFVAAYLIIARKTRHSLPLIPYLTLVYASAAACMLILILLKGLNFWLLPLTAWIWIAALAIGPNLLGHSILNWASRRLPVYTVNMALLSESVLATVYAMVILSEYPPWRFYPGAALIIVAVWLTFKSKKSETTARPAGAE